MPEIAASVQQPPQRRDHPCIPSFLLWATYLVCAAVAAVVGGSSLFLLLGLPSLGFLYLFGENIVCGYPQVDAEATQRLDRIVIDVAGLDAFSVTVQDQISDPVALRRGGRPHIFAATGFVTGCSDELLRGVAALQHASLRCSRMDKRRRVATLTTVALVLGLAGLTGAIAPRRAVVFAGIASVGVSFWLFAAAASAWSRLPSAGDVYLDVDPVAAELVGDPSVIADALAATAEWRTANRKSRSLPSAIAHRMIQPVLPSQHETERIARLRDMPKVQAD